MKVFQLLKLEMLKVSFFCESTPKFKDKVNEGSKISYFQEDQKINNCLGICNLSIYEFEDNCVKWFKKIHFGEMNSYFQSGKIKVTNFLLFQLLKI